MLKMFLCTLELSLMPLETLRTWGLQLSPLLFQLSLLQYQLGLILLW